MIIRRRTASALVLTVLSVTMVLWTLDIRSAHTANDDWCEIGVSYRAVDGLTVTLDSFTIIEKTGSYEYVIFYTLENENPDIAIDEGAFKMYYKLESEGLPQYGFFGKLFPGDLIARSYTFEELKSKPFDVLEYHHDNFFSDEPLAGSLKWKVVYLNDSEPPITVDDYDGLWHNTSFTITLTATDFLNCVEEAYYRIDDGPVKAVGIDGHPYITTESANTTLEYWSVDDVGNEELPHKILTSIKLDKTAPTIKTPSRMPEGEVEPNQPVTVSTHATDVLSGITNVTLSCLNIQTPTSNATTIQDLNVTLGLYRTTYYYQDAVPGHLTLTHLNGTPFEGTFSLYVVPHFGGHGRTDYHNNPIEQNGFAHFNLFAPAFVYGPGDYTIGVAGLSTVDGYVIAAPLWDPSIHVTAAADNSIWTDLPMTPNTTSGLYEATIPEQPAGTLVNYQIMAYDNAGNLATDDHAGHYYTYTVIPELPAALTLLCSMFAASPVLIAYRRRYRVTSNPVCRVR